MVDLKLMDSLGVPTKKLAKMKHRNCCQSHLV